MAKRILSWVLSMALLLSCVSGLTLIASAGGTYEFTFDASAPGWHSGGFSTDLRDYQVVLKMNEGQTYWNNGQIAKTMGFEGETAVDSLSLTFEYFFDCSAAEGALGGRAVVDTIKDGGQYQSAIDLATGDATNALAGQSVALVANEWSTVTYVIDTPVTLGAGHDVGYLLEGMGGRTIYVRKMTLTVTVGEDTYLSTWEGEVFDPTALDYGAKVHCTDADYISNGHTNDDNTDFDTNWIGWNGQGDYVDFKVNMKEAGRYNIDLIMTTGVGSDAVVEVQDGNGKVHGSVTVPNTSWDGPYEVYTVPAMLKKGEQTLRIYFAKNVANLRGFILSDGRYTLTNAEWNQANSNGAPAAFNGTYAFKYASGGGKWFGLKDVNGILAESTSVTYEYEVYFDTENGNDRLFVSYGTTDGWRGVEEPSDGLYTGTGFACGGHWIPEGGSYEATSEDGNLRFNWVTLKVQNDKFDPTKTEADEIARLGSWVDNGTLYLKSMRVYDTNDESKVIAIEFNSAVLKDTLQAEVDGAITDSGVYSPETWYAYQDALTAARDALANAATQEEIDAALAALIEAKEGLADGRYTLNNATTDMNIYSTDKAAGMITLMDDQYVWQVGGPEAGKFMGIGDPNGILAESTSVVYEYDIYFDCAANLNARVFLGYGKKGAGWIDVRDNGDDFNGFAAHAGWVPGNAVGTPPQNATWGTIAIKNDNFDPTILNNGCITRLGFWNENCDIYVKAIRVYDANDNSKMISLTFNKSITKEALQAKVDRAIEDLSIYSDETAAAYKAAIEAAKELLAKEEITTEEIDAAIKAIEEAEAGLKTPEFDLIIVDISTTQGDNPKIGDKVFFTITVKNNSNDTIHEGAKYGAIVKIGDTLIGWSDHYKNVDVAPALAPGETLVLTLCGGPEENPLGAWIVTEGAVEVFAQVNDNPAEGINESNLENNTFTKTITPSNLDFTDLNEAIAEEVTDLTPYTKESADAYTAALEAAKALIGKLDATQEQIDAALEALENAYFALTEKGDESDAILGDVDGDGKITSTDARLTLQYYAEKITENDLDLTVADVDGDGKITSTDARLILQFYAEKIDKFPVAEA
ncbi:MAG: FIVAR domain-containing protein [Clostridia bacterium]|nr:FIVAR domain-containing protein [Clostridia bacterium]